MDFINAVLHSQGKHELACKRPGGFVGAFERARVKASNRQIREALCEIFGFLSAAGVQVHVRRPAGEDPAEKIM